MIFYTCIGYGSYVLASAQEELHMRDTMVIIMYIPILSLYGLIICIIEGNVGGTSHVGSHQ